MRAYVRAALLGVVGMVAASLATVDGAPPAKLDLKNVAVFKGKGARKLPPVKYYPAKIFDLGKRHPDPRPYAQKLALLRGGHGGLAKLPGKSCSTVLKLSPRSPNFQNGKSSLDFIAPAAVSGYGASGFAYFWPQNSALSPNTDGVHLWFTPPAAGKRYLIDFYVNVGNGGANRAYRIDGPGGYQATVTASPAGHVSIVFDAADANMHDFRLSAVNKAGWWLFYSCEVTVLN
jgi:hypothetical protein